MNLYRIKRDYSHQGIVLETEDGNVDLYRTFDGTPIEQSWTAAPASLVEEEVDGAPLLPFDLSMLASHMPVFSGKARALFYELLTPFGEFLELKCAEVDYYAFNVTKLVDALDEESSDVRRFSSSGRIKDIRDYHLTAEKLGNPPPAIFKLRETPLMDVFVNESFRQVLDQNNFKGLLLNEVSLS